MFFESCNVISEKNRARRSSCKRSFCCALKFIWIRLDGGSENNILKYFYWSGMKRFSKLELLYIKHFFYKETLSLFHVHVFFSLIIQRLHCVCSHSVKQEIFSQRNIVNIFSLKW